MKKPRTKHLEDRHKTAFEKPDQVRASRCGMYVRHINEDAGRFTTDRSLVTCKNCLRYMNSDEGAAPPCVDGRT